MVDAKKLPLWKRITLCVLMFSSLLVVNLAIFAVPASANASAGGYTYVVGCPIDLEFMQYLPDNKIEYINLRDVSLYEYDDDGTPVWRNSAVVDGTTVYANFTYSDPDGGSADIFISTNSSVELSEINTVGNYLCHNAGELFDEFQAIIGLYMVNSATVTYEYRFNTVHMYDNGITYIGSDYLIFDDYYIERSGDYVLIPVFHPSLLTAAAVEPFLDFTYHDYSDSYERYFWLTGVDININSSGTTNTYYVNSPNPTMSLIKFNGLTESLLRGIFASDLTYVDFEDISWTDWLVNSVGAFMDFELVPNLSFSMLLAFLLGMSLFMMFLKYFAGG